MIASIVLALAVLSISGAMAVSSRQSDSMDVDARSLSLAQQLLERIVALPFDQPAGTPEPLDDISDYNDYEDVVMPSPTTSTSALSRSVTYTRHVTVQFRSSPSGSAVAGGDLALVTVTVTPNTVGTACSLHRLASRYTLVRE